MEQSAPFQPATQTQRQADAEHSQDPWPEQKPFSLHPFQMSQATPVKPGRQTQLPVPDGCGRQAFPCPLHPDGQVEKSTGSGAGAIGRGAMGRSIGAIVPLPTEPTGRNAV